MINISEELLKPSSINGEPVNGTSPSATATVPDFSGLKIVRLADGSCVCTYPDCTGKRFTKRCDLKKHYHLAVHPYRCTVPVRKRAYGPSPDPLYGPCNKASPTLSDAVKHLNQIHKKTDTKWIEVDKGYLNKEKAFFSSHNQQLQVVTGHILPEKFNFAQHEQFTSNSILPLLFPPKSPPLPSLSLPQEVTPVSVITSSGSNSDQTKTSILKPPLPSPQLQQQQQQPKENSFSSAVLTASLMTGKEAALLMTKSFWTKEKKVVQKKVHTFANGSSLDISQDFTIFVPLMCSFSDICSEFVSTLPAVNRYERIHRPPHTPYRCTWPQSSRFFAYHLSKNTQQLSKCCLFAADSMTAVQKHFQVDLTSSSLRWLQDTYIYIDRELIELMKEYGL